MEKEYAVVVEHLEDRVRVSLVDELKKVVCIGSGAKEGEAFQEAFNLLDKESN